MGIQAIGTDAVGGIARSTASTVAGVAGNVTGGASGATGGAAGAGLLTLAAAGSAASAAGAIAVNPGMIVRDASGRAIGEVQGVRARANGLVDQVLVEAGNRVVALPADNFSVSGDALVSAMSRAEVRKESREQPSR